MSVKSSDVLSRWPKAVLAIDCALGGCVVGLRPAMSGIVLEGTLITEREQAAKLVPMIQGVLDEANIRFADLGLIVTTVGPGSFTGLRIGLSAARSLGLALDIPVQGVSTLEAMAASCADSDDRNYLVVIDAKRSDFYVAGYDSSFNILIEPRCMMPEEIAGIASTDDYILCGDAVPKLRAALGNDAMARFKNFRERSILSAKSLIDKGQMDYIQAGKVTIPAQPVYMRDADVSVSLKPRRTIENFDTE